MILPNPAVPSLFLRQLCFSACISILLSISAGCVHKVDVHQGNLVSAEQIEQLKLGMTQEQVVQILGSPMLADPFHNNRWDYYTRSKTGRKEDISQKRLTLQFEGEKLASIE